jgi:hypothetical protein
MPCSAKKRSKQAVVCQMLDAIHNNNGNTKSKQNNHNTKTGMQCSSTAAPVSVIKANFLEIF